MWGGGGGARVRACVCACVRVFVRACMRECVSACVFVSFSLSSFFLSKYSSFLLCLQTLFAEDYLVYYKHYHNIAVSCTKTGIKHDQKKEKKTREWVSERNIVMMDECFWINATQWCAWQKKKCNMLHNSAEILILCIRISKFYNFCTMWVQHLTLLGDCQSHDSRCKQAWKGEPFTPSLHKIKEATPQEFRRIYTPLYTAILTEYTGTTIHVCTHSAG